MAGGSDDACPRSVASTLRAMSMMLPPIWRATLITAAGCPFPVARIGGRKIAGEIEAEDRKDGRRHPLDAHLRAGGHVLPRLVDLALHQLQGVGHVRVGVEQGRELGCAADGPGPYPPDPEHSARR